MAERYGNYYINDKSKGVTGFSDTIGRGSHSSTMSPKEAIDSRNRWQKELEQVKAKENKTKLDHIKIKSRRAQLRNSQSVVDRYVRTGHITKVPGTGEVYASGLQRPPRGHEGRSSQQNRIANQARAQEQPKFKQYKETYDPVTNPYGLRKVPTRNRGASKNTEKAALDAKQTTAQHPTRQGMIQQLYNKQKSKKTFPTPVTSAQEKPIPPSISESSRLADELKSMFPDSEFGTNNPYSYIGSNVGISGKPLDPRGAFMAFLGKYQTALPLQSLWTVIFRIPNKVTTETMNKWGEYVGTSNNIAQPTPFAPLANQGSGMAGGLATGSVNSTRARLLQDGYPANYSNPALGCLFAQTVGIPAEQSMISTVGPSNRGFLKGPIMEQRQTFSPLNIEFLETNVSFLEFILRPWAVICQHEGLVARNYPNREFPGLPDPNTRVTTDMTIINYGKTGDERIGLIPRKIWFFTDCFPVNIGTETYTYKSSTDVDRRDTEWNFRRYQVIVPQQYLSTMDAIQAKDGLVPTPAPAKKKKEIDLSNVHAHTPRRRPLGTHWVSANP